MSEGKVDVGVRKDGDDRACGGWAKEYESRTDGYRRHTGNREAWVTVGRKSDVVGRERMSKDRSVVREGDEGYGWGFPEWEGHQRGDEP